MSLPTKKPNDAQHFDDRRMEVIMGRLLQVGVLLASAVVLLGGMLYLRAHAGSAVDYRTFVSERASLRQPADLLPLVATGNGASIIQLGVLLLIATPIARVVFAAVAFGVERDRLYVAISLVVLTVLIIGLFYSS